VLPPSLLDRRSDALLLGDLIKGPAGSDTDVGLVRPEGRDSMIRTDWTVTEAASIAHALCPLPVAYASVRKLAPCTFLTPPRPETPA